MSGFKILNDATLIIQNWLVLGFLKTSFIIVFEIVDYKKQFL